MEYGGSFSFTIALDSEYDNSAITVKANGATLTPVNGVYTIANITADQTITVEGVELNTYTLTVVNGTGSGSFASGSIISIVADEPPVGYIFDKWVTESGVFADSTAAETTFTMPSGNVTVTASYRPLPVNPPAGSNQVTGISDGSTFVKGDVINFTAIGGGMDNENPNAGDTRWFPGSWSINQLEIRTGDDFIVSFSTDNLEPGEHTLTVTFLKQEFDGTSWVKTEETASLDIDFTVEASQLPVTGDKGFTIWFCIAIILSWVVWTTRLYRVKPLVKVKK